MQKLGPNDPCHCGLGKKYKKCCQSLDDGRERRWALTTSSRTLTEKNQALMTAMWEIFGLRQPWNKVRDGMSDGQIREFYTFIADLWPLDTDPKCVMPAPDSS